MPVGQLLDDHRAICAYSGETPTGPLCAAPASHHILALHRVYGVVGVATCAEHYPIAVRTCPHIAVHAHAGYCDLPATRWDLVHNRCVLSDDGREPVQAAHDVYERTAS